MDEYISKQSVIDYLNGYLHSIGEYNLLTDIGQRRALTNAIQDIGATKPADVQPVKHGKWVTGDQWWTCRCSNCYHEFGVAVVSANRQYLFCPHCGARMEGGING